MPEKKNIGEIEDNVPHDSIKYLSFYGREMGGWQQQ